MYKTQTQVSKKEMESLTRGMGGGVCGEMKSDEGGRGKDEVNVEGEGDRKWADVTHHPRCEIYRRGGGRGPKRREGKDVDGG